MWRGQLAGVLIVSVVAAFAATANADASVGGESSVMAAQSQLQSLRQTLGLPVLAATPGPLDGCGISLASFNADNPLPGRTDLLVAALAPQTTSLGVCLDPSQQGYHSPATDRLYSYPADGQASVEPGQPLLVFAAGPFVERPASANATYAGYWRMRTTVSAASLTRVRDGVAVALAADDTAFTLYPGWALTPQTALTPATNYHAQVTLTSAYGSKTLTWNFQTKGASGVLAGSAISHKGSVSLGVQGDRLQVTLARAAQTKLLLRRPNGTWLRASRLLTKTTTLSLHALFGALDPGRYTLTLATATGSSQLDFDLA